MENNYLINKWHFQSTDLVLLIIIALVCVAPALGSFCIIIAMLLNIIRMFIGGIHTFMFDMICLMPFANIYKIAPATPSVVLYLILLGTLYFFFSKRTHFSLTLFLTVIYLIIISGFLLDALTTICASLILVFIFARSADDKDVIKISMGYVLSVSISVVVAFFAARSNLYFDYISEEIGVDRLMESIRFKGLFADPNYLGTYLLSAIAILCQLFISKRVGGIFFGLFALLNVSAGVITYSKSFFLIAILIAAFMLFYLFREKRSGVGVIFAILMIGLVVLALKGAFSDINIILGRFDDATDVDELTTGRSSLWNNYINSIFSDPFYLLFGRGLDAKLLIQGSHNLYLEVLYYTGIVGLIAVVSTFVSAFKGFVSKTKGSIISYLNYSWLTLFVLAIAYFALNGLFGFSTYFQFFVALLMLRLSSINNNR